MNVLCVGFGFVGKAYALYLRELGHEVFVRTANDNTQYDAEKYSFPLSHFGQKFDAVVIAVPTPTKNNKQDVSILEDVLKDVRKTYYTECVVIKSTVLPKNILKLEKKYSGNKHLFVLYPEFLEAKNPIGGVFNQSSLVFGKEGDWKQKEKRFLSKLFGFDVGKMTFTNLATASMLKYVHNIWLACNISFWNSMMRVTKLHNVDFNTVLKETHKSKYFGPHPWHIGTTYSGKCLPKDTKAFISSIKKDGVFKKFIQVIDEVNEEVRK